jgi:putative DNA primase/helicase
LLPDCLRYHGALYHWEYRDKAPAMVAPLTDVNGNITAVHVTWLARDGSGKAPFIRPVRKTPGLITGSAIRLAPVADELCIGEGIETSLSVMQSTGRPAWAAGSTHGLKTLRLLPAVRKVVLLADGDEAGRSACNAAAQRFLGEGRQVRIAPAPDGKDFNGLLKVEARNA